MRIYRAEAPTNPQEYEALRRYTNAVRDLRTGIDDERQAYEDDRVKAGDKKGQPREVPEQFKLRQAQQKVQLAVGAANTIETGQMPEGSRLRRLGQTLIDERHTLEKELTRMRECAGKAQAQKDMTKFKDSSVASPATPASR